MYAQTMVVGFLGKDPELRYTPSGRAVCEFSVATSERFTDSSGQPQSRTTWYRTQVWRKQAEACQKFLKKGSKVMCVGSLQIEERSDDRFSDADGNHPLLRYITLRALQVKFLDSRPTSQSDTDGAEDTADDMFGGSEEELEHINQE